MTEVNSCTRGQLSYKKFNVEKGQLLWQRSFVVMAVLQRIFYDIFLLVKRKLCNERRNSMVNDNFDMY